MGKKLHWFAKDAGKHLANPDVLSLSWPAKGVYDVIQSVLWAITDKPGYFIKRGKNLDEDEIVRLLRVYQGGGNDKQLRNGFNEILSVGLLEQDEEGCFYSPAIVEMHEESQRASRAGQRSAQRRVQQSAQQDVEQSVDQSVALHNITKQNNTGPLNTEFSGTPIDELAEEV